MFLKYASQRSVSARDSAVEAVLPQVWWPHVKTGQFNHPCFLGHTLTGLQKWRDESLGVGEGQGRASTGTDGDRSGHPPHPQRYLPRSSGEPETPDSTEPYLGYVFPMYT